MLDAAQCASILRCPERTIHALIKLGHLDGESSGTDTCRVTVTEFQRFLQEAENRTALSARSCQSGDARADPWRAWRPARRAC
jgi:hypothetical protein